MNVNGWPDFGDPSSKRSGGWVFCDPCWRRIFAARILMAGEERLSIRAPQTR